MQYSFGRLLRMECRKAIGNKFFKIAFGAALCFALLSAWYCIDSYFFSRQQAEQYGSGNPMLQVETLYNTWIGGEGMSLGFSLFFTLLPLLATLPYGWSYFVERKSGYERQVMARSNKKDYFLSKYIATFLAGGLVILIPLLVNFFLVACFIPAILPDYAYMIYYGVELGHLGSSLFYTIPILFVLLYLVLDFIFAGLFACMSLALSLLVKNRVAVMLLPFLSILAFHYGQMPLVAYRLYIELSPLYFLHSTTLNNRTSGWVVLLEAVLLFGLTFGITMKVGITRETF